MIETYRRYYYNLCILQKCIIIKYENVSTYSKPKINIISLKKLIATRCKLLTGLQVKNKKQKINKNRKIKSNKKWDDKWCGF